MPCCRWHAVVDLSELLPRHTSADDLARGALVVAAFEVVAPRLARAVVPGGFEAEARVAHLRPRLRRGVRQA